MAVDHIEIVGAREHNLKNLTLRIPREKLVVVTGLSGSGKSSLAFDTVYVEGQRRYVESLSAYARQFLQMTQKPAVEHIAGLPPTIAIEQRRGHANPRSTVGTTTEIYDYLRLLYARAGTPHCPQCGRMIERQSAQQIVDHLLDGPDGRRALILAPLVKGRKGEHKDVLAKMKRDGYVRARIDGKMMEIHDLQELPDRRRKHVVEAVVDRLVLREADRARLADSVETALKLGDGVFIAAVQRAGADKDAAYEDELLSEKYGCPECNISFPDLEPRLFSFNAPFGACPGCDGLGSQLSLDTDLVVPDPTLPLNGGAIDPARRGGMILQFQYTREVRDFAKRYRVNLDTPFQKMSRTLQDILLYGDPDAREAPTRDDVEDEREPEHGPGFAGIIPQLERQFRKTQSEFLKHRIHAYMAERSCPECGGLRLRPEVRAVKFAGKSICDFTQQSTRAALAFVRGLTLVGEKKAIAEPILREVEQRLAFMSDVGLDYLTLDRATGSLSGGEHQRIRLASQVGSGLVGVCYVLDEPTIGLHQRDNGRLLATLKQLRGLGNTVIVVEHDEEVIRAADYVFDLGPGAGEHGGHIVASGTVEDITRNPDSPTGRYLSGTEAIVVPEKRRKTDFKNNAITLRGARGNNLKNLNVAFPLGAFTCVTGVSGSGKSTLVTATLARALARSLHATRVKPAEHDDVEGLDRVDKMIEIDQTAIGKTPRSNPATYTGVFNDIRRIFASTAEAKARGYQNGRFSFNVKGGRCEHCEGAGEMKIEMHFLPDVYVPCEVCHGARYNRETLEVRYKGKNIADVLHMPIEEAAAFFKAIPSLREGLDTLVDVGLGYVRLGQSSTTLSGGEAQRVKLATELSRRATGKTFYILDEPTTGLHFADIQRLLAVLNRLVDMGNTVLVIEHNLDVIKSADWIVDLGPEGGDQGGTLLATGTPEQVARNKKSFTGQYLKTVLAP